MPRPKRTRRFCQRSRHLGGLSEAELSVIRPLPECGARQFHGSENDGGGRWLESFDYGVKGLARDYGVRRNIDRSAMLTRDF
jgi:hypothetical protein